MLAPITIRYPFRAVRRSLATAEVHDLFGVGEAEPPHVVADNLTLDIRPGEVVLFTGPSGSGKSSLMRAVGEQLNAVDAMSLTLPDVPLVDALPGTMEERLGLLAACGLGEARLVLRTPGELSDGQRYRFRVAPAVPVPKPAVRPFSWTSSPPCWIARWRRCWRSTCGSWRAAPAWACCVPPLTTTWWRI